MNDFSYYTIEYFLKWVSTFPQRHLNVSIILHNSEYLINHDWLLFWSTFIFPVSNDLYLLDLTTYQVSDRSIMKIIFHTSRRYTCIGSDCYRFWKGFSLDYSHITAILIKIWECSLIQSLFIEVFYVIVIVLSVEGLPCLKQDLKFCIQWVLI